MVQRRVAARIVHVATASAASAASAAAAARIFLGFAHTSHSSLPPLFLPLQPLQLYQRLHRGAIFFRQRVPEGAFPVFHVYPRQQQLDLIPRVGAPEAYIVIRL